MGLLMTWPQLSHEAPLPRVLLLFSHRLGSSQGSACSLQVSVFPAKTSLSPHSPAPCWAPGGLAAPGPLRLAPRARLLGREVRLCFQAGKEERTSLCSHHRWDPANQGRTSRCLSWALGLNQGNQAELATGGSNCQVREVFETQACSGHQPTPATLSMPWPGSRNP